MQGLISGINAARHSDGKSIIILERESSYIGTLIDDLVTKDLREPYRMLTRYYVFLFENFRCLAPLEMTI